MLEPIILILGAWFLLKKFYKPIPTVIRNEVRVLPQQEPTKYKVNIQERKYPETIYSSNSKDVEVHHSDGDLIPFNLSDGEKELLNMFYERD